jgi:hypothetical protein
LYRAGLVSDGQAWFVVGDIAAFSKLVDFFLREQKDEFQVGLVHSLISIEGDMVANSLIGFLRIIENNSLFNLKILMLVAIIIAKTFSNGWC